MMASSSVTRGGPGFKSRRLNHYETLLRDMSDLTKAEDLTDMTVHCLGGPVFLHRKVLFLVSPLIRQVTSWTPANDRVHLILSGVSRVTMQRLLTTLYTGQSPTMTRSELDDVLALCTQLKVDLGSRSILRPPPKDIIPRETIPRGMTPRDSSRRYCICREGESPGMIGCDFCDEWYHYRCLSLTRLEAKSLASEKWKCPNCELQEACQRNKNGGRQSSASNSAPQGPKKGPQSPEEQPKVPAPAQSTTSNEEALLKAQNNGPKVCLEDVEKHGLEGWSKVKGPTHGPAHGPAWVNSTTKNQPNLGRQGAVVACQKIEENSGGSRRPMITRGKRELQETTKKTEDDEPPRPDGITYNVVKGLKSPSGATPAKKKLTDREGEELHFCYKCRSIFLSKSALEEHKRSHDADQDG